MCIRNLHKYVAGSHIQIISTKERRKIQILWTQLFIMQYSAIFVHITFNSYLKFLSSTLWYIHICTYMCLIWSRNSVNKETGWEELWQKAFGQKLASPSNWFWSLCPFSTFSKQNLERRFFFRSVAFNRRPVTDELSDNFLIRKFCFPKTMSSCMYILQSALVFICRPTNYRPPNNDKPICGHKNVAIKYLLTNPNLT
jgi:hypothetical protein